MGVLTDENVPAALHGLIDGLVDELARKHFALHRDTALQADIRQQMERLLVDYRQGVRELISIASAELQRSPHSAIDVARYLESGRPPTWHRQTRRCPLCLRVSYHPEDARHRYCSCCGGAERPKQCEHHPLAEPYPGELQLV